MLRDLLSIIYPEKCSGCQKVLVKGEEYICLNCRNDLPRSFDYLQKNPEIMNKLAGRVHIDFVYSYLKFRKGGIVQSILHDLKYENHKELGITLGRWFGEDMINNNVSLPNNGILVPIPLHRKKQMERGYNQSELFAKGIAESTELELKTDLVWRKINTKTQTHKSKEERWQNVKESFSLKDNVKLNGQNVIIVDDVLTTGATIEACGQLLSDNGVNSIGVFVLAEAI